MVDAVLIVLSPEESVGYQARLRGKPSVPKAQGSPTGWSFQLTGSLVWLPLGLAQASLPPVTRFDGQVSASLEAASLFSQRENTVVDISSIFSMWGN